MDKRKKFIIEGFIYQIIWVAVSAPISICIYKVIDNYISDSITMENSLNKFQVFYREIGVYMLVFLCLLTVAIGAFIIQKKWMDRYYGYFKSGLDYLKNDSEDLIPFHESLSEEREMFVELHDYHKALEEKYKMAYKEKTDMLTYLAHDIKTPLANMIGYITLLNDEKTLSEEQRNKFIQVIYENTKFLNQLSEEFFSYLKFSLNDVPLNLVKLNIEVFFKQWAEEQSSAIKSHLLALEFLEMEQKDIITDPQMLLRIMENLIVNAVNYSVKGTEIRVKVIASKESLKIKVINEPLEHLKVNWDMVTSKFYRGDLSRGISRNGSGLGLTIVTNIVSHLGGEFKIGQLDNKVCAEVTIPCEKN